MQLLPLERGIDTRAHFPYEHTYIRCCPPEPEVVVDLARALTDVFLQVEQHITQKFETVVIHPFR